MTIPTHRGEGRAALLAAAATELRTNGAGDLSLRAIARRAGVSHAAPKYHFGDRAGLLTALVTEGYAQLGAALESAISAAGSEWQEQFSAGGRAYLEFGLENSELFTLMFRTDQLDLSNAELMEKKDATFGILNRVVSGQVSTRSPAGEALPIISWAFIHGLVVLAHDGALKTTTNASDVPALAKALVASFGELIQPR